MAPRARFELAANRLTADCSTTELPRNTLSGRYLAPQRQHDYIKLSKGEDFFPSAAKGMNGKRTIRLGNRRIPVPSSLVLRIGLGFLLLIGGFLWFLPLLGAWMLPLGLLVLSVDFAIARRLRRRGEVKVVPLFRRLKLWWTGFRSRRTESPKEK